jgi:hypothetical protein
MSLEYPKKYTKEEMKIYEEGYIAARKEYSRKLANAFELRNLYEANYQFEQLLSIIIDKTNIVNSRVPKLEEHNKKMKEALEHTLKVFRSMSDRGAYPLELLPFEFEFDLKIDSSIPFKDNSLFLGKQGYMYIIDAINNR